ncbi:MAG: zinc ribbon domain-containing protein [Phycisphaerales bacterium]|jgi:putative FmdB family regulatory protein|nr:zinc ribbon domain-containing protein [Phycisphaerales bacterium]
MPTYEYRCKACEHAFDLVQSMTAPVKRKCPECGRLQLERLIGVGAGFIIKGGAASAKAEAAEKAADEKARTRKADAGTDAKATSGGKEKASSETPSADAPPKEAADTKAADTKTADTKPADTKTADTKPAEPPEKKISGATSTPTHAAREGRGVGNLVDKAKRRAKEASGRKPKRSNRRGA